MGTLSAALSIPKMADSDPLSDVAEWIRDAVDALDAILAPAWQAPSFGSGWADFGASQESVRYCKAGLDVIGVGLAKRTSGSGTTIYTLPVGFRPSRQTFRPTMVHGATAGALQIETTGVVTAPSAYVTNGNHLIVAFRFRTDQP